MYLTGRGLVTGLETDFSGVASVAIDESSESVICILVMNGVTEVEGAKDTSALGRIPSGLDGEEDMFTVHMFREVCLKHRLGEDVNLQQRARRHAAQSRSSMIQETCRHFVKVKTPGLAGSTVKIKQILLESLVWGESISHCSTSIHVSLSHILLFLPCYARVNRRS